jgi:hypothetical protein
MITFFFPQKNSLYEDENIKLYHFLKRKIVVLYNSFSFEKNKVFFRNYVLVDFLDEINGIERKPKKMTKINYEKITSFGNTVIYLKEGKPLICNVLTQQNKPDQQPNSSTPTQNQLKTEGEYLCYSFVSVGSKNVDYNFLVEILKELGGNLQNETFYFTYKNAEVRKWKNLLLFKTPETSIYNVRINYFVTSHF